MKKIFTLIAMAAMALGASAQTEWRPSEEAPAAGSSIIKDDLLKVATVFETTCSKLKDEVGNLTPVTYGGKTFETYMQIRVDAAPTADNPTGTDKGGSTPLVITAKKNVDLTVYYRRQAANDAYAENDGKDMKLIDQSKPSAAIAAVTYETFDIDGAYANAIKVFKLEEGKVYTLWARGTTGRLYGLDYVEGTGAGGGGGEAGDGTFMISFDGMSAANKLEFSNGFTLQITGNETKTIGNGKNKYPVGLITLDEAILAGFAWNQDDDTNYLYNGRVWWSMSPTLSSVALEYIGVLHSMADNVNTTYVSNGAGGIRPVIALKNSVKISGGNGTSDNPFTIAE